MEVDSNDSHSLIFISESNIRVIGSNIQAQLDGFDTEVGDSTLLETSNVCDVVRDQILYYEDEPYLSKNQNNCRRICIASDLLTSICSVYGNIVDSELTKIIDDMVQWEKFKKISRKILHKMQLETKREKYFAKEAETKLFKAVQDATLEDKETEAEAVEPAVRPEYPETVLESREGTEQIPMPMEITEQIALPMEGRDTGRTTSERDVVVETIEALSEAAPEIREAIAPPLENIFREETPSANMTEMRADSVADISRLQYPMSSISRHDPSLPETREETSIGEPIVQEKNDDDISRILQMLEDFPEEVGDIPQPVELKSAERMEDAVVEELITEGGKQGEASERSEEWSLPHLEPVERARKRARLIIDKVTVIPDYAARAVHLNRNINIQRVQVFEGPPKIIQAVSINHLMNTPGFKSSLFEDVRSSKLSTLFKRHLKVEKKPVEPVLPRGESERKRSDVSKVGTNVADIIEEVRERVGMRSLFEKSDVLSELPPDKSRIEDLEIPAFPSEIRAVPPTESLIGMPLSRIITSTIEPPEEVQMERINAAPVLPIPRVQQLQGKSLDPKPTSSWFLYSKQNPPKEKYREFNYMYKKLQQYWAAFEIQGMEKCITLREFFVFEEDSSVANYLTALRIVDKLSIQRKLLLEYDNGDVIIKPFECPHVSDKQLLLKGKEPLL